jgi:hypothetical protein
MEKRKSGNDNCPKYFRVSSFREDPNPQEFLTFFMAKNKGCFTDLANISPTGIIEILAPIYNSVNRGRGKRLYLNFLEELLPRSIAKEKNIFQEPDEPITFN